MSKTWGSLEESRGNDAKSFIEGIVYLDEHLIFATFKAYK